MATSEHHRNFVSENRKTVVLADILREYQGGSPPRILVVGCGTGIEAAVLAQRLQTHVTGIDIDPQFDKEASEVADLQLGDATCMDFDDASFDFVYSYHVLEHIPDYQAALREIRRVLKPGGGYMIGTPNRTRLIGYLGSEGTALIKKIEWNLADWSAKMRGKFRNEFGAHAGYSLDELHDELTQIFTTAVSITSKYYFEVYSDKQLLVSALLRTGTARWFFPAVYFYGTR